jgi:hypothetical protein
LSFEAGPSVPVQLQWATYFDASDQSGISRIWGGIHPPLDDFTGRRVGAQCGQQAYALAHSYWDGSVAQKASLLSIRTVSTNACALRYTTLPGLYYKLQSTADLSQAMVDEPGGFAQALHSIEKQTNSFTGPVRFFRVVSSLVPR